MPEVAAVLAAVARVGPFFAVDVGTPGPGWSALDAGTFAALVDGTAQRLGTAERRVAASILLQGLAARVASPVLAGLDHGVVLDLDPAVAVVHPDEGARLRFARVGVAASVGDAVLGRLAPLVALAAADGPVAVPLLWGNVASSLVGALLVLEGATGGSLAAAAAVRELLAAEPLAGTWERAGGRFRRRSCCLYYRVPGGGYCGDCALLPAR